MPIRRRARRRPARGSDVISTSFRWILPAVGSTSRLMQRIRVDLPAPEGPMRPTTWPAPTSKETPRSARSPVLYCFSSRSMRSMRSSRWRTAPKLVSGAVRCTSLLAGVGDAVGLVDLADHRPVVLEGDLDELGLAGLRELLRERRALPREREESLLDLLLQLRGEVVDHAVAGRREGLRRIDHLQLVLLDDVALDHARLDGVRDRRGRVVLVGDADD